MKPRGITLLEMVIALAIVAVLATVAAPSLGAAAERSRLRAAAETLAADLAEARFESARLGRTLHVAPEAGPGWCWAVASASGCGCRAKAACQLKTAQAADYAGIELADARPATFDPTGAAPGGGSALFRSSRGEQLKVDLSPLGRARVCSPGAGVPNYPVC